MLTRDEALVLLHQYLRTNNLLKHSYAVEAIMRAMAKRLNENQDLWGVTGLLHDLDFDFTKTEPEKHALMTIKLVGELLPEESVNAIKAHNFQYTAQLPQTYLDKGLICADAVSGLVIAAALVMPSKKLADVTVGTLESKFKDKSFAQGCNRKRIELCQDTELTLEEFLGMSLKACQGISTELEL